MQKYFWLLLLSFALVGPTMAKAPSMAMQEANELYRSGEYNAAQKAYEELLQEGFQAKELYFNLGNAYFKMEDWANAVLNYEKARVLAPQDRQVIENLALVKTRLDGEILQLEVFPLIALWQSLRDSLPANTWTFLAVLLFWGVIAGMVLWILSPQRKYRKWGFYGATVAFVLFLLPLLMGISRKKILRTPNRAIIMQNEIPLKATPAEGSETLYTLFAGATVQTQEVLDNWQKVNLANGYQGWVKSSSLEVIWPEGAY